MYTETEIRPFGGPRFDSGDAILDLSLGTRFQLDLTDRLGLGVGGDIDGFDMGGSKLTWSAVAMPAFDVTEKLRLIGGYRVLVYECDEGSGANQTELDLSTYGPNLGVTIFF